MDRPTIIGIADGPMHPKSELVRKVDLVIFGDWPKTFEPHRIGKIMPLNWRYSPLVVAKQSVGVRRLTGVQVFWGPDNKELANLLSSEPSYVSQLVIITNSGDGSASKTAKKLGALIEIMALGRLVMVSCAHSVLSINYENQSSPKSLKKEKVNLKVVPKEIEIVKKKTQRETVVVVKTKIETENDNK